MPSHSENSSVREKLLEYLFIGEVLKLLWMRGVTDAEFLRPEVDAGGYDLVIACGKVVRHIQLKASHDDSATREQTVHLRLMEKPSGCVVWMRFNQKTLLGALLLSLKPPSCVVWMRFNQKTLELGPFLWFGNAPGEALPDIRNYPKAKHSRGNSKGVKQPCAKLGRLSKTGARDHLR